MSDPLTTKIECEFYTALSDGQIVKCDKQAKYLTPEDKINKAKFVCGIHKRSVDGMNKRLGKNLFCKKIRE